MIAHQGTQVIETRRLLLRPFTTADAQLMYDNWASDPDVTKYLTWPTHSSPEVTKAVLADWVSNYPRQNFYQWAIVLKELGQPIGSIGVVDLSENISKAEIGYCMGKAWWHQGIMTEALKAVMDYMFDRVGLNRVEAAHDANNPHSGAVMKKCGMLCEGTHRQWGRNNQGVCDITVYALLAKDRG